MFNIFKEVEQTELEILADALTVFTSVVNKLESLQAKVKEKYAAHTDAIEDLEKQKIELNTIDTKIHNTLLKLKELVA